MSITFGGLATGLDTNAIVDQLMALERTPITRLQTDKTWFESRNAAYGALDGKLRAFMANIKDLGSSEDLRQKSISASSEDFFSVTASADALPGASYQVEVVSLAQVQKNVSQGYTSKSAQNFGLGELTLTVGENDPITITIDETNNSLDGIMQAINDAAVNEGLDADTARLLTLETALGAARLALESAEEPGTLQERVTSPGGTTEAAVNVLDSS